MVGQDKVYDPSKSQVFVFGSNRAGLHAGGAAAFALVNFQATWEVGEGPLPSVERPKCYAIPTMDEQIDPLQLPEIQVHVDRFLEFARKRSDLSFFVIRIGCGIAGFKDEQIAPLFANAPSNCELPIGW